MIRAIDYWCVFCSTENPDTHASFCAYAKTLKAKQRTPHRRGYGKVRPNHPGQAAVNYARAAIPSHLRRVA